MKLDSIGEVIAERALSLTHDDGRSKQVVVLLGRPRRLPDHPDYYCPYQIKGLGPERIRYACGIDLFQALMLALSSLAADLEALGRESGGRLHWDCGEKGGLGFPPLDPSAA